MAAELPRQDPKALWKELDPETDPVTLEQIHALAARFDRKARLALLLIPAALICVAFIGGQEWQMNPDPLARTTVALQIAGMLLSGWLMSRVVFPSRDPSEPAGAYLRRRLQRSLVNVRGGWLITAIPLLPAAMLGFYVAYVRAHPGPHAGPAWVRFAPAALFIAVLVLVLVRTRTGEREIKAQLDEVERLLNG